MTKEQFDVAYRAFSRRRPFRSFLIEFMSGSQVIIPHPEAVDTPLQTLQLYMMRSPDGGHVVFAAEGVSRLADLPATEN